MWFSRKKTKSISKINQTINSFSENEWNKVYLEHACGTRSDVVPFPSEEIQKITNGKKGERTGKDAISIVKCIMDCINDVQDAPSIHKQMDVLDYGCGWGRMTRYLPYYFEMERITGVDVDVRLIDSANQLLPFMNHKLIDSMEPLPFEGASFDVIFANSVFSHLSEKSAQYTLSELSRLLKKGGILVISVLEENEMNAFYSNEKMLAWITKILGNREEAIQRLNSENFAWGSTGKWHEYGIAITNDTWVTNSFQNNGLTYRGTKRGNHRGTQNYKVGLKT